MNETSTSESVAALLGASADPVAAGWNLRELAQKARAGELIAELEASRQSIGDSDPAILGGLLRCVHTLCVQAWMNKADEVIDSSQLRLIYEATPPTTPNRHLLLHLLALDRTAESLAMLVQILRVDPPEKWIEGAQVLSPLMQHDGWPVDAVYPALLHCLEFPALAAPLLDLANYLTRKGRVSEHPATAQLQVLNTLLGQVSAQLSNFEDNPRAFGDDVDEVQSRLGEAVALAVSLCDAVGLIGDESSIGKLNQTIDLKHRRVQCEAAGALARLGDDAGKERLVELSKDPAARLRAIHYADELGFGERIDADQRSDKATAEAEMALWLCQPQQMGVPPTGLEVIDSRRMLWPSYTDPIDVFLVRFEYSFGDRQYSNVGITGPVAFAMSADVAELPVDDIYAIYAGWHAEHDEIFVVPADQFNEAQSRAVEPYTKHLEQNGYESIKPEMLGFFLDEQAGIFSAVRDATACLVVTDGLETVDQPTAGRARPLSAGDLFNLYKGRKMLRTFNP